MAKNLYLSVANKSPSSLLTGRQSESRRNRWIACAHHASWRGLSQPRNVDCCRFGFFVSSPVESISPPKGSVTLVLIIQTINWAAILKTVTADFFIETCNGIFCRCYSHSLSKISWRRGFNGGNSHFAVSHRSLNSTLGYSWAKKFLADFILAQGIWLYFCLISSGISFTF